MKIRLIGFVVGLAALVCSGAMIPEAKG